MMSASVTVDFKKMLKKNLLKYAENRKIKLNSGLKKQQIINKLTNNTKNKGTHLDFYKLKKQDLLNLAKHKNIKVKPSLKKQEIIDLLIRDMKIDGSELIDYAKKHKINAYKTPLTNKELGIKKFINDSSLYLHDLNETNLLSYAQKYDKKCCVSNSKNKLIERIKSKDDCSYLLNKPYCPDPGYRGESGILFISLIYNYFKRKNNYNFFLSKNKDAIKHPYTYKFLYNDWEKSGITILYKNKSPAHKTSTLQLKLFHKGGVYEDVTGKHIEFTYKFDEDDISNFKKSKKRFLIIPVLLDNRTKQCGTHANVIIYDSKTKILEYFEPHGGQIGYFAPYLGADLVGDLLSKSLIKLNLDVQKVVSAYPYEIRGTQHYNKFQKELKNERGGYCARWCDWFVDYRLKHENESVQKLTMKAVKNISKTLIFIRNYTKFIKQLAMLYIRDCMISPMNADQDKKCKESKMKLLDKLFD